MNYKKLNVVLVDGCDRQTLPLAKALKELGCTVTTINGSVLDNGYTSKFPDKKILDRTIYKSKSQHLKVIEKILLTGEYDVAISTSDDTAEGLSLLKSKLRDKVNIAVVEPDLFYMAYDKNKTMKVCMDNDIPCPKTFLSINNISDLPLEAITYPLVVKPKKSFGAIGYKKIENENELSALLDIISDNISEYIFQEYIPQTDIQYECAMFVDGNNEVKTACVFSKNRWFPVDGGSSTCNVTVERKDIIDSCAKLLKTINWRGPADIDLIQDPRDNTAKIMEINPRVSGSVKIVLNSGVNIAKQILQLAMGEEVESQLQYKYDVRLRCIHTDLLWFLKSKNRFSSKPSWFSWKRTKDQIWSFDDPLPFFAFSLQALLKYKKEMEKRKQ